MTQTGLKHLDKSNTMDKQESSSKKLVEINEVPNTPFAIVREEKIYTVILGQHKISPPFDNKKDAEKYSKKFDWEILMQVVAVMIEKYKQVEEIYNQNK